MTTASIPIDQRQVIFRAVIEAQDNGASVTDSRAKAIRTYGITAEQVKAIEHEGIEGQWPPL